jgi:flagellar hook-basal body complex protein FliE
VRACYASGQIGTAVVWLRRTGRSIKGENMTMPVNALSSALQQMQSMAAQAAGGTSQAASEGSGAATAGGFASALKASLDKISGDQKTAIGESQAFELGSSNVSLNDVMVDMQKANVGFQFGLQVRNKLVSAYNEIAQMSV